MVSNPDVRCQQCDKIIERRWQHELKTAKFCGNECKLAYQKIHPTNDHGKRKTGECIVCGEKFFYWESVRPDARYCCYKCKASDHGRLVRGKNGGRWVGNERGKVSMRNLATRWLPQECAICGWHEATCDAHHIVKNVQEITNMIILCPNHHRKADEGLIPKDYLFKLWSIKYSSLDLLFLLD